MTAGMPFARLRAASRLLLAAVLVMAPARADDPPPGAVPQPEAEPRRTLKVAIMPIASATEWKGERPTGVMIDIWQDLAGRLGVGTEFVRAQTLSGMIDTLKAGGIDIALGPLAITEERERVIDMTHSIFHSGLRIAVRQRNSTGFLAAVESLLSWRLLALLGTVIGLALVSGHLLWWFERGHNDHSFPATYPRGVWEAVWWIASTIVTGGCDDKHVDSGLGRALAFAWMVGGIMLLAAFTSVLTATMTAERVSGSIHSPRDLAGRVVGCQKQAVSGPAVRQRGGVVEEYATIQDAIDALALGMVEAVVGENQSLMFVVGESGRKDIRLVGPVFESFDFGLALANGSPFRESLNTAILRMREDGTLDRIKNAWFGTHE